MAKRASPGVGRAGHNSGLPTHDDVRTALAIEMIMTEEAKKLREKHKRARKKIEGMGIPLSQLGFLKEMQDMTGSEMEEHFKLQWHLAGAIHEDRYEQLDIFSPKPSAPQKRAAHFMLGMMAGLKGLELEIPPLVVGDDRNQMIDGHNVGREKREAANLLVMAEAVDPKNAGKTFDGKTGKPVGEKAAEDFAKDQAAAGAEDPLVVNGERYKSVRQANAARARMAEQQQAAARLASDAEPEAVSEPEPEPEVAPTVADAGAQVVGEEGPEAVQPVAPKAKAPVMKPDFHAWDTDWLKWTGAQSMEARRWFESLPEGHIPAITHEGAVTAFNEYRQELENKAPAGPDEPPEEKPVLPAPQAAELPDPADIAAGAAKLEAEGFTASAKKGRGQKNLAK